MTHSQARANRVESIADSCVLEHIAGNIERTESQARPSAARDPVRDDETTSAAAWLTG